MKKEYCPIKIDISYFTIKQIFFSDDAYWSDFY